MRQARAVDIHEWYRTGGINGDLLHVNFDVVIIRACVGDRVDALLREHVDLAVSLGMKYATYCIPDPDEHPDWQADYYLEQYGVMDGIPVEDVEPKYKGAALGSEYFYRKVYERIADKHPAQPWYYSNYNNTKAIGNPAWIKTVPVWWAEYRYQFYPLKYRKYEPWLDKYAWWIPRWATELGITPMLHQFTDYGDARYYLANAVTNDPDFKSGMTSCDLNVSLIDDQEFLSLWDYEDGEDTVIDIIKDHEKRITRLESFH